MKIIVSFICLALISTFTMAQNTDTAPCLSVENFETVFHYIQWKRLTSKKLSPQKWVIVEKAWSTEAYSDAQTRKILFYQNETLQYTINGQDPYTVVAASADLQTAEGERLFCDLLKTAQLAGLPPHYAYTYADGSANVWQISSQKISYDPVTPEQSSSGMYSGGTPFKLAITLEEFLALQALFLKAEWTQEDHTTQRIKGSGAITQWVNPGMSTASFILKADAPTKQAIEQALAAYKKF